MNVVICGEVFSGNLGDGIIHDSLVHLVRTADSSVDIATLDLSGRQGFASTNDGGAMASAGMLRRLNRSLYGSVPAYRRLTTRLIWARRGGSIARNVWSPVLDDADVLVIGGGNLLIDNDLNFPLKLRDLARAARMMVPSPPKVAPPGLITGISLLSQVV